MRFIRILAVSLAIHLLLAELVSFVPPTDLRRPISKQPMYVDLLEAPDLRRRPKQPPLNEKTFVRSAPAPESLLTKEKREKRFASEDEQTVLEEQKAQASGMTENRSSDSMQTRRERSRNTAQQSRPNDFDFTPSSALDRAKEELKSDGLENGDIRVGGADRARKEQLQESSDRPVSFPSFNGFARGISTLGSDLPDDIKYGNFTALNTDRHLYYSFYSRMEDAIRHRWETYVRAAIYEFQNGNRKIAPKDRFTTKLEVILDDRGRFERAIMAESSGVRSFDSAPVQAFRDAEKFPNPPKEMIKDDGRIHIYYAFTIDVAPRYANRGPASSQN